MLEHARTRTPEKLAIRIRPPDEPTNNNSPAGEEQSPFSQLRMPDRESTLPRWLSVEQVRKMQRMRRETVIEAMQSGELPFERRGRICYIRLTDVIAWEERRLRPDADRKCGLIHPDLADLA